MTLIKCFTRRLFPFLMALLLAFLPAVGLGENSTDAEAMQMIGETGGVEAKYYAFSTVALKVRKTPEQDSPGVGSITKGATVFILELTNEDWAQITFERGTGYVQRKYLEQLTSYDGQPIVTKEEEEQEFSAEVNGFRVAYKAYAVKNAALRLEPSTESRWLETIPTYQQVDVSVVDGDWCYARYKNEYGYIRCKDLFKWDRLVADAGEIPGLDILPLMAFVKRSANIYDAETNEVLKTVNPGAALGVFEKDGMGRYTLPYWRTTGYIKEEDVAYVVEVAENYENAQPGELISVMSTYYALGISTLQYQGRNWNIHLAASMITGVVLQPGEVYDQYQIIGPYRKSTGYHAAPIMKKDALWGYGGGTCQVNTTFYIANVQVPIVVTHRMVHSDAGVYYAKKGFDAAVGGGNINLTLENTLPYAIRYHFFDSDGVLTCCIYRES